MIECPSCSAPLAPVVLPWEAEPYKLWSLLEMQRFYGASFMSALGNFAYARGVCACEAHRTDHAMERFAVETLGKGADELAEEMAEVPISYSLREQLQRLRDRIKGGVSVKDAFLLASEFEQNLHSEFTGPAFAYIPASRKMMFIEPEKWFGDGVLAKFGTEARKDLSECAQCFALARWTASVFHAMRILEHGMRALAARIGVTFSTPVELESWKNVIDQIEKEIRKQEALPKSTAKSEELKFCAAAASQFFYFKEAWRNHVMHSRVDYDESDAIRIVTHVRDFMRALA